MGPPIEAAAILFGVLLKLLDDAYDDGLYEWLPKMPAAAVILVTIAVAAVLSPIVSTFCSFTFAAQYCTPDEMDQPMYHLAALVSFMITAVHAARGSYTWVYRDPEQAGVMAGVSIAIFSFIVAENRLCHEGVPWRKKGIVRSVIAATTVAAIIGWYRVRRPYPRLHVPVAAYLWMALGYMAMSGIGLLTQVKRAPT